MNCELCQAPPGQCDCAGQRAVYCRSCEQLRAELAIAKREISRLREELEDERLEYQVMISRA